MVDPAGGHQRYRPLPLELSSFVGRRSEAREARKALSSGRLLTVTGPAGVGKTRLALHVADRLQRTFPDGVCLIELAELRDAALVADVVADSLGVRGPSSGPAVNVVIGHLKADRVLLVLDNCEHLVDACADLVDALLRFCPRVHVLATSRQPLGVYGEHILRIGPLAVPSAENVPAPRSLLACDAVRLFVDRATAVLPEFAVSQENSAVLARLLRSLEGVPLVIELAARWLSSLSLDQIEQRVRLHRYGLLTTGSRVDPDRHRTLRGLIDWSYELCTEAERLVWRRASMFSGGFDAAAAEYVCQGGGLAADDVPGVLTSLVHKSLLFYEQAGGTVRYRMLETIRDYGQHSLAAEDEHGRVRHRHRDYYARLVRQWDAEWVDGDQVAWVDRLRRDHANLRAALHCCAEQPGGAVTGLRMASLLDDYWGICGLHTEARYWLDTLLRVAPAAAPERASALRTAGWFALLQGNVDVANRLLAEAAEVADRVGDRVEAAYVTHARGMAALFTGHHDTAVGLFGEALAGFRALDSRRGKIFALFSLALALGWQGDHDQALALLQECLAGTVEVGQTFWRSYALWAVSYVEVLRGAPDRAEHAGRQALQMHWQLDNKLGLAFSIDTIAWIEHLRGDPARAATLFGAAEAVWDRIGAAPGYYLPFAGPHDEYLQRTRTVLGARRFAAAFQRGRELPIEQAVDYAVAARSPKTPTSPAPPREPPLTRRERQIAELVAAGLNNREISDQLVISRRTAEAHVQHILVKLGFTSRTQIAAWISAGPPTG
ncbi:ATP-binding protein [Gandjariella thermophila]|uniref:LuxR family transcriptional regulator n=1 Tax=Gandjariella thermophila TaxID=1931992 RepID=A0A4D4JAI2_9PSEU|nr:LuxR C-terminal-related transcriptional regulator [Gandjariella thermophila]GDY32332.1 LuxR family transcriptional regulator [Gandjariella thermophila]